MVRPDMEKMCKYFDGRRLEGYIKRSGPKTICLNVEYIINNMHSRGC